MARLNPKSTKASCNRMTDSATFNKYWAFYSHGFPERAVVCQFCDQMLLKADEFKSLTKKDLEKVPHCTHCQVLYEDPKMLALLGIMQQKFNELALEISSLKADLTAGRY